MSKALTNARPYAEALFSVALERDQVDDWSKVLASLATLGTQAREMIMDPRIQPSEQVAWLSGIVTLPDEMARWLSMLAENNRLTLLPFVQTLYHELSLAKQGKVEALVATAFPLSDALQKRLGAYLSKRYNKEVSLVIIENKALIGGLRVTVGDEVIDCSIQNQLLRLRKQMIM